MQKINYKTLGRYCQKFRSETLKKTQKDVADDTGLVVTSISMFENGHSRSSDLLLWYILKGLPSKYLIRSIEEK